MTDQMTQIENLEHVVNVAGHDIKIREVKMKDLQAFSAACRPFMSAFDEAGDLAVRDGKNPSDFALFNVLAEHSPAFMQAAALVSNTDVTFFERLRPDEFFEIAAKVVEVNGSFFIKALAPALLKFAQVVSQIGTMLSSHLLAQDMTESKSSITD
jgi:hypothetical protein